MTIYELAFEQAERDLGERIGYPSLVYESLVDIRDDAHDLVAELRAELATAHEAIKVRDHWLTKASAALETYMARYGPLSELRKDNVMRDNDPLPDPGPEGPGVPGDERP